jgi:L-alanine-DL-glutamate epimerase-like enolase superfamily enzyme
MATVEAVDFFYLRLPVVRDIGDGSQDALLVRVRAGGVEGWGECEAAPLPTIAAWCCPLSHSACHPVRDGVLGQPLNEPADIRRINARVRELCFLLPQADHTLSGVDVALWDALARRRGVPVHALLTDAEPQPKRPYASILFGDTPDETGQRAADCRQRGFTAAKFGWGPYGHGSAAVDAAHVAAARAGLGADADLLIDAGTVWGDDVAAAAQRLPSLRAHRARWLEEPFAAGALHAYAALAALPDAAPLAGGEAASSFDAARQIIDHGRVAYIQIDAGIIGGLTTARQVVEYARARGVIYVNHTFTSSLALAASITPFWDWAEAELCEFPADPSPLGRELTGQRLLPDADGLLRPPPGPGLGLTPDPAAIERYLVPVRIEVAGQVVYDTPAVERQ